jgi:hypothetical protein
MNRPAPEKNPRPLDWVATSTVGLEATYALFDQVPLLMAHVEHRHVAAEGGGEEDLALAALRGEGVPEERLTAEEALEPLHDATRRGLHVTLVLMPIMAPLSAVSDSLG